MPHTIHEEILSYMILSENESQVGYPMLKEVAKESWYKLFKKTKESIIRKWVPVTNGIVAYPKSLENLLGMYVVNNSGELAALYEDNFKAIIEKPKTACSCNSCDTAECMCPSVQDGQVLTDVVIEGTTYTNKVFTRLLKNGNIVEQSFIWTASYNPDSSFKEAVEVKSERTICSVTVMECGCPVDCAENAEILFRCGCLIDYHVPYMRERYPSLYNDYGYYKTEPEKRQIHVFSKTGKKSKITQIEVVFQSNGEDMLIPDYAKRAFKALLDWGRKMYSPSYNELDRQGAKRNYKREEMDMLKYLNPIPYELVVQNGSYGNNIMKGSYYRGIHSDFISQECDSSNNCSTGGATSVTNVTNIINSTGGGKLPLIGVVDDGGEDDPVSGLTTFQSNKLIGLGLASGGKIKIEVDDNTMSSYGQNKTFDFNSGTGEIAFTLASGYSWQTGSSLWINLNQ